MLQKSENFRKLFADALEKEEFRKVCLREDVFPVDLKAFNYLIKICLKKKIKLYYIDRVKMNNFDLLKKNTINDSYIYIKNKHVDPNMKKFSKDSVFLFTENILGIPIFVTVDNDHISMEHTHPPHQYILTKDNFDLVKKIKNKFKEIVLSQ